MYVEYKRKRILINMRLILVLNVDINFNYRNWLFMALDLI